MGSVITATGSPGISTCRSAGAAASYKACLFLCSATALLWTPRSPNAKQYSTKMGEGQGRYFFLKEKVTKKNFLRRL